MRRASHSTAAASPSWSSTGGRSPETMVRLHSSVPSSIVSSSARPGETVAGERAKRRRVVASTKRIAESRCPSSSCSSRAMRPRSSSCAIWRCSASRPSSTVFSLTRASSAPLSASSSSAVRASASFWKKRWQTRT